MKERMKKGFTLVEIMIVVAIIAILAAIAIPNFIRYRKTSQMNACISNLKAIRDAAEQSKLEGHGVADSDLFGQDKYIKVKPNCPGDSTKSYTVTDDAETGVTVKCNGDPGGDYAHKLPEDKAAAGGGEGGGE